MMLSKLDNRLKIGFAILGALLLVGPDAALAARKKDSGGSNGVTPLECRTLGGTVSDGWGEASWMCCFDNDTECWECTDANSPCECTLGACTENEAGAGEPGNDGSLFGKGAGSMTGIDQGSVLVSRPDSTEPSQPRYQRPEDAIVRDHRDESATRRDLRTSDPAVRDHRDENTSSRDHRTSTATVRNHRTLTTTEQPEPIATVRDHRTPTSTKPGFIWVDDHWERKRAN
jgi:hypothetical protein